jgi:hypothetical protein
MHAKWNRGPASRPWFLAGVFLTCMCGLMLQIMETRALSVVVYYHLAFFAIGVAMLGMTAGALIVFFRIDASYAPDRLYDTMARVMTLFAWAVLVSLIVLLNLALGAHFAPTLTFVLSWALAVAILLPPYVLLGITVSLALTRSPQRVSLVYGVDLIGAAAGCLVTLAVLGLIDTYSAVLVVGAVAVAVGAAAALAFNRGARAAAVPAVRAAEAAPKSRLNAAVALSVLLLAAAINVLLGTHGLRPVVIKGQFQSAHELTEERWNSFSRISMVMGSSTSAHLWSPSRYAPSVSMEHADRRKRG